MIELLPKLVPLLVIDVLNPVLFALMIVAVSSSRPIANSTALLAGHTASYLVSGVIIAIGLNRITDRFNNPLPVDFVIELLLGLLCLWAALASRNGAASKDKTPERELTPVFCLGYGAVVNFIGVPFAIPYFAAVDQILKANLSTESSISALVAYNIAYAIPFLLVPILVFFIGERSKPVLTNISDLMSSLVDKIMPVVLLFLGLALTADAIAFLVAGKALW
jgi:cytochrome c biogenesis protein CcdA